MSTCLINQSACGRKAGNPVCPKCGMDERVVYPGQVDLEAALEAARARYVAAQQAVEPPPPPEPPKPPTPPEPPPPPPPPKKADGTTAMVVTAAALLGGGWWYKSEQDDRVRQAQAVAEQARRAAAVAPFEPKMVSIPGGSFTMGSSEAERAKVVSEGVKADDVKDEAPQRGVKVPAFELAQTEVTRAQYAAFVRDTGHSSSGGCHYWTGSEWKLDASRSWQSPGYAQADDHPVTCISWDDARAYIGWLNRMSGKNYRLPSEAEWEFAARGGSTTRFAWGEDKDYRVLCNHANGADVAAKREFAGWTVANCDDGFAYTSPVARYKPNSWGLHDMNGNVWEWVQDCYEPGYDKGQPTDGDAHRANDASCDRRVVRGGSWGSGPQILRSAIRGRDTPEGRYDYIGFRLARTVS